MSITSHVELAGIKKVGEITGLTLRKMREYARPGMSTRQLDTYGASLLRKFNARSAPNLDYGFPGATCISVNGEAAHGIPSERVILKEGDLVNIDVSAELDGYYADNGGSFVLGADLHRRQPLVDASSRILFHAISRISGGVRIAEIGGFIEQEAKRAGFRVIKNLVGHGIGRSLHEAPFEIPCFFDMANKERFRKNSVVAVETFISTQASYVYENGNGWTYSTRDGSLVAQHEHTIIVTDDKPIVLTAANAIWE